MFDVYYYGVVGRQPTRYARDLRRNCSKLGYWCFLTRFLEGVGLVVICSSVSVQAAAACLAYFLFTHCVGIRGEVQPVLTMCRSRRLLWLAISSRVLALSLVGRHCCGGVMRVVSAL